MTSVSLLRGSRSHEHLPLASTSLSAVACNRDYLSGVRNPSQHLNSLRIITAHLPHFRNLLLFFNHRLPDDQTLQSSLAQNLSLLGSTLAETFTPAIQDDADNGPHLSLSMPPFKIITDTHDHGEKPKRFGHEAPTFDSWLEIYLQDDMPDYAVAILLNGNSDEVQEIKSCIRHHMRFRTLTLPACDIYYSPPGSLPTKVLCQKGGTQLGCHLSPSKLATLIRSPITFAVRLEFPHLFKEPASLEEYQRERTANAYTCFTTVPHHFRRDILARLVDICAEEMKKDKTLREGATDPNSYTKRPASDSNTNDTSENK